MNSQKQLRLPFETPRETKAERCQRLLSDIPQLKTAAQIFDYNAATTLTTKPVGTSTVSPGYVIHTPLTLDTHRPSVHLTVKIGNLGFRARY